MFRHRALTNHLPGEVPPRLSRPEWLSVEEYSIDWSGDSIVCPPERTVGTLGKFKGRIDLYLTNEIKYHAWTCPELQIYLFKAAPLPSLILLVGRDSAGHLMQKQREKVIFDRGKFRNL